MIQLKFRVHDVAQVPHITSLEIEPGHVEEVVRSCTEVQLECLDPHWQGTFTARFVGAGIPASNETFKRDEIVVATFEPEKQQEENVSNAAPSQGEAGERTS